LGWAETWVLAWEGFPIFGSVLFLLKPGILVLFWQRFSPNGGLNLLGWGAGRLVWVGNIFFQVSHPGFFFLVAIGYVSFLKIETILFSSGRLKFQAFSFFFWEI